MTKSKAHRYQISLEVIEAAMTAGNVGFCTNCGQESADNCEPDAREYHCHDCGKNSVYGAEELLVMGLVR